MCKNGRRITIKFIDCTWSPGEIKCTLQVGVWTSSCRMGALKQSLDRGILINHWPTAGSWQAAPALSAAAVHSCAHLPAQLLLMHICWIPHLFMRFLLWMSLLPLTSCFTPSSSLPLSSRDSSPVGPLFSSLGQDESLPKSFFSSSAGLIGSAGAKKKKQCRYIAHNLFMVPFEMCDI